MRYNPPELLEDYLDSKKYKLEQKRGLRPRSSRRVGEDSRRTSVSEVTEDSEAESESAEDVIFALFGPRVWDHEGEWDDACRSHDASFARIRPVIKFVFELKRQNVDATCEHRPSLQIRCSLPHGKVTENLNFHDKYQK